MPAAGWRKCSCCKEWIDPGDDSQIHNNAPYGENVCFKCSWADNEECENCRRAALDGDAEEGAA